MKTTKQNPWGTIFIILVIFLAPAVHAGPPAPGPSSFLDSWSFLDTNYWTDDYGDHPISFTNIFWSPLGNGSSLVVDTNVPAWLNYEVYQTDVDETNIIVNGPGSITLWFGPNWATTNGGPGNRAQLIDVGEWTSNASSGYFGLSVDPTGSNLWFSSQDGMGDSYNLFTPISWTTDYFHFIALTYSATNVSLYLDGNLATNDPGGLSIWPPATAISGGLYFGSDTNGNYQADGLFNTVQTYDGVLDSNDVEGIYQQQIGMYEINMYNIPYMALKSATSSPSYTPTFEAISGAGSLLWVTNVSSCVDGSSAYDIWITNFVASMASNGTMNVMFTIEGGEPDVPYDVFANSMLHGGTNGIPWVWMGQGYQCKRYMLNLQSSVCFLMLGTPYSSNPGFGLTDAYELLVLQINPNGPQFDSYGVPYAWYAQHGLTTITNGLATADPDKDGLLNYQEYRYGTDPQVSEGFTIWISTPNGTTEIP